MVRCSVKSAVRQIMYIVISNRQYITDDYNFKLIYNIHTYIHIYIHAHIHTYIHIYIHTYVHTYTHIHTQTHTHTHTHTYFLSSQTPTTTAAKTNLRILWLSGKIRGDFPWAMTKRRNKGKKYCFPCSSQEGTKWE